MPVRPQDVADQEMPSSTGVAVDVMLSLDVFDPDGNFGTVVERVLKTHAESIESAPAQHPTLLAALEHYRRGHLEITITGSPPPEWFEVIGERYLPDLLLTWRPPTDDELEPWLDVLGLDEAPAIWAGRSATDGPTAYVCRNACSPPVTGRSELEEWITEFQHAGPQPDSL